MGTTMNYLYMVQTLYVFNHTRVIPTIFTSFRTQYYIPQKNLMQTKIRITFEKNECD